MFRSSAGNGVISMARSGMQKDTRMRGGMHGISRDAVTEGGGGGGRERGRFKEKPSEGGRL